MREINELEHYQKAANHHIEQYDAEYKRADVEREILESQLKALEGELERLRQLVASERIRTDKVFRENHTLQKQLNEMLCTSVVGFWRRKLTGTSVQVSERNRATCGHNNSKPLNDWNSK